MGTISKYISDDRLDLILTIMAKMIETPEASSSNFQNQLSQSLTIAETSLIAIGIKNPPDSEDKLDEISQGLDGYLNILDVIGVPLTLPLNKMNPAQLEAIEKGHPYLEGLAELKAIWKKANSDQPTIA